jgi:hypothetical protein
VRARLSGAISELVSRRQRVKHVTDGRSDDSCTGCSFYGMHEFIVRDINGFWVTFGQTIQT